MGRVNVWLPDELHAKVRAQLPGVNVSQLVQEALAARLECRHGQVECAACRVRFDLVDVAHEALSGFYSEAWYELAALARREGTASGAVAAFKRVGERFGIRSATTMGVARPTAKERRQALDARLADLDPGRRRRKRAAA